MKKGDLVVRDDGQVGVFSHRNDLDPKKVFVAFDTTKRPSSILKTRVKLYKGKCPREGCTDEVLEGNVHCANHYFSLPEDELRKGWESTGGQKFDQDKPRMDLLDAYAIEELAKVLTFGAKKYAPHNWRKGIVLSRLLAASARHLFAIMRGEDVDEETGLAHAAHLMCCAMFLIWTMKNLPAMDDRWKTPPERNEHGNQK